MGKLTELYNPEEAPEYIKSILENEICTEDLMILDRDRTINYNGEDLYINTYKCNKCDAKSVQQVRSINYCSNCGAKFENQIDISV